MIAPSQLTYMTNQAAAAPRPGAPQARRPRRASSATPGADVAIRLVQARDETALRELEELDGRSLTGGAHLLAELGGVPVAAIAVADESVVADPFAHTAGVVDLLRVRARQLRMAA